MQQTQQIQLENIRPLGNNVLVKINVANDVLRLPNGIKLFLDTSYSARHTSINLKVMKVPERLVFNHDLDYNTSLPHKTEIEIKEGDEVFAMYLGVFNCFDDPTASHIDVDGQVCFFIDYRYLICAKREWTATEVNMFKAINPFLAVNDDNLESENIIRDGEKFYSVIPLNGNTLAEEFDEVVATKLIIPNSAKKKDKAICKITFSGSCNSDYWQDKGRCDDQRLKNGMKAIVAKDVMGRYLEPPEHSTFNGKKIYSIVERQLVEAFFE